MLPSPPGAPTHVPSIQKAESSRRNGAKSRGPKTARGKKKSSANAMRHGLRSNSLFVLANERPEVWQALLDDVVARYRPEGPVQQELCLEIAWAIWRMRRSRTVETGLLDSEMDLREPALNNTFDSFDEGVRLADGFKSLADNSRSLDLLLRYGGRCRRDLERSLDALARVQAEAAPAPDRIAEPAEKPAQNARPAVPQPNPAEELSGEKQKLPNEPDAGCAAQREPAENPLRQQLRAVRPHGEYPRSDRTGASPDATPHFPEPRYSHEHAIQNEKVGGPDS
jgi:hypothetical protein